MLTISRNNVSSDTIQIFPRETRFLKLPVENYIPLAIQNGVLGGELNRPQIALLNAVNNPDYRFITAAFSRRVGKTTIANMIAQLVSLVPNCNVLIMAPNYSLSSISFELQRRYVKAFSLEIEKDNAKDRVLELSNGSTVRAGSVSQVDSVVGRSYDLILFDEAALSAAGEEAFNIALRPTLDKPNSKAIFISTPRGRMNWFSRFYDRGFSDDFPQWVSMHCDYKENPRASNADIEEAKRSMSRAEFEQEYLASFSVFEGQIFTFNKDNIISTDDYSECIMGIDVGFRDPTAVAVISLVEDEYYVVGEYLRAAAGTDEHAGAIKALEEQFDVQAIFVDAAAAQFRYDLAMNHDISSNAAKKSVLDGIAFLQNIVESGRLFVDPDCKHTLEMLDQYRWDEKTGLMKERPLHDKYSHMADALRYALYSYRGGQEKI